MIIDISGKICSVDKVSVPTKGFGEAPDVAHGLPYTLLIPKDQVLRIFGRYYDEYVSDAKTFGIEDDEIVARSIRDLHFPSFFELMEIDTSTACNFLQDVIYDFLNAAFFHVKHRQPLYFIKTVDRVEIRGKNVALLGQVLNYRRMLLDKIGSDLTESVPCKEVGYGFNSGQDESDN